MALIGWKRSGCTMLLPKHIKSGPPTQAMVLYFFIVAPGRRWQVKKKKNVKSVVAACSASVLYVVVSLVLVKINTFFF